ncbi:hypothetical protein V6N13_015536 [Hibiscus sabdariffa]|uniref:Uncharacterized protein n=1 Tax=Hibiscus sabdariffa TaxID=183260 RepID=A0ABR2CWN7_9ROSI
MAGLSLGESDNKENIPPSSSNNPTLVLTKSSSSNKPKRRLRKPLQDITNLVLPQICSVPVQSDTTVPVPQPICRKRRAENEHGPICKKTSLVYKSRNFR